MDNRTICLLIKVLLHEGDVLNMDKTGVFPLFRRIQAGNAQLGEKEQCGRFHLFTIFSL